MTTPEPSGTDLLASFKSLNPSAVVTQTEGELRVTNPWNDQTIEFVVPVSDVDTLASLNAMRLPPPFTAVWHVDTKDFEIIWAPVPPQEEMLNRAFVFNFDGVAYKCEFSRTSDRVMRLADRAKPRAAARAANYRNLMAYKGFLAGSPAADRKDWRPTSFWIHEFDWDEAEALELVKSLNFYMMYFDAETPRVLIHEPQKVSGEQRARTRHLFGDFPKSIQARRLEPHMLGLWHTAADLGYGDTRLNYLYNYQILEYAGFYYLKDEQVETVKRLLLAPETPLRPDAAARQILDTMAEARAKNEERIAAVVRRYVDPRAIWDEIEPFKRSFSQDVVFDGGFKLSALIKEDWNADDFRVSWLPKFPDSLRHIRDALVHARQAQAVAVITPTTENEDRLVPWLGPISRAAMQVVAAYEL